MHREPRPSLPPAPKANKHDEKRRETSAGFAREGVGQSRTAALAPHLIVATRSSGVPPRWPVIFVPSRASRLWRQRGNWGLRQTLDLQALSARLSSAVAKTNSSHNATEPTPLDNLSQPGQPTHPAHDPPRKLSAVSTTAVSSAGLKCLIGSVEAGAPPIPYQNQPTIRPAGSSPTVPRSLAFHIVPPKGPTCPPRYQSSIAPEPTEIHLPKTYTATLAYLLFIAAP
ncbi:hypothetical protein GGTG_01325 [Gaeumannomyces tritici R3-111a-1]|uniref:Uncharacterized protein n=1 Tax=Gaeumannomyces tritici (strain R3-111a-1) TaxID=644352 RepID=J3NJ91_GAET3|nr:hypothetical protein GGTG_01325 [Gaeumannomyces tritici R3-111a-1]EJT81342.1 hypothetical protein GGTG_01325 [Gaeumannomyces tritici R3-111a-1]